jgi:PAS domain S-box-containing protein
MQSRLQLLNLNGTADLDVQLSVCGKEFLGVLRIHRTIIEGVEAFIVIIRDVTEERKKDLDLLRFTSVFHYTINPIQITDANGKMMYVNPAFERASGYSKEELVGKDPKILNSGKQGKEFWQKVWQTITAGKIWTGEVENRRKSGAPLYTQLVISPIIDAEEKVVGFFGAHRDITDQKYLERQLIHAQKMESIGTLAAGIAHEVGNPLTSISSVVQVIQRTTEDAFIHEKLELIKSQVTRISKIIRDLVDFSRRSNYEVQLTDINRCIHHALEIVKVGKKSKDIQFETRLSDTLPVLPLVPDQIEQVFINLFINAVDAICEKAEQRPPSPGAQKGTITMTTLLRGGQLVVTVEDDGKGIAEDALPKIFEPFYTTKRVGEGTGLGLWVSYGIIKSFQGEIKVQSEQGQWTKFTIALPQHKTYT